MAWMAASFTVADRGALPARAAGNGSDDPSVSL
jgi:hypothetical protein